jgi:tetrahydromethanopterin S-methyltransferase subunit G
MGGRDMEATKTDNIVPQKQRILTSLEKNSVIYTFLGFVITSFALIVTIVVGFYSLRETSNTLDGITVRLDGITERLELLEARDETITERLNNITERLDGITEKLQRVGESIETTRVMGYLQNDVWNAYLERIQSEAIDAKPPYLEADGLKKIPTELGKAILKDSELIDRIQEEFDELRKEGLSPPPANRIIRRLTVGFILNKAQKNKVSLDIMIAVINAHIERIINQTQSEH